MAGPWRSTLFVACWLLCLIASGSLEVSAVAQSTRDAYSALARDCYPSARKVDRSRVCPLDTGNLTAVSKVARSGSGDLQLLAQEILSLQAANVVTADEMAEHEKNLVKNVAEGFFAESGKDLAGAVIDGASESRKLDAARSKIEKRQTQLDVIVNEKLPRIAASLSGPKVPDTLLRVHPFYKETKIVRKSSRPGVSSTSGSQHFQVDLRNESDRDLHRVTVLLQMRDAQDRIETYLGFWDLIEAGEIVPLCTWKTGSRHTDHYAGCAIPLSSTSHFVRYSLKVWSDEGRSELPEQEFEHQRLRSDLVTHERESAESAERKRRQADAKRRAEEILANKSASGKKPSPSAPEDKPSSGKTTPAGTAPTTPKAPKVPTVVASNDPAAEPPADDDDEVTEPYVIDFTAGTDDEPEGWSAIEGKRRLIINRSEGKPYLTPELNVVASSQAPLITIRGDFFIEFTVLSTELLADGPGNLVATLEGRDGVPPLALSIVKGDKGFNFGISGSDDESRPAALGGKKPHKVRFEREETAFRALVDGKVVLKYAGGDAPDYDVLKLTLANIGLRVYRIQIGPLKK